MHTPKQIERLWSQGRYTQLFSDLVEGRLEAAFASHLQAVHPATAAAAMGIIRLEELSQSHVGLCRHGVCRIDPSARSRARAESDGVPRWSA